jgi:hypothetical protein
LQELEEHLMRELMQVPLLRLFILNGAMGIAFGIAIGAALFALDFRGVGALAWRTEGGLLAFAMICAGLSVTCGSVAIATAVMLLPERAEDDTGYGHLPGRPVRREVRHGEHASASQESPTAEPSDVPHNIPRIPRKAASDADA